MIPFNVVGRTPPGDPSGPVKYYAQARTRGVVGIDVLTHRIEQISTVSGADIRAVLYALVDVIPDMLENGQIVELGELGRLRVSLSSNGSETAEEVSSGNVRSSKILFRPGSRLRDMQKLLKFFKDAQPAPPDAEE